MAQAEIVELKTKVREHEKELKEYETNMPLNLLSHIQRFIKSMAGPKQ